MPVTIHIPTLFRPLVAARSTVAAAEGTVGELFAQLDARYPGFLDGVIEEGELRPRLYVFVNGREIRSDRGLQTPVGVGDEVHLLPSIRGGARCAS